MTCVLEMAGVLQSRIMGIRSFERGEVVDVLLQVLGFMYLNVISPWVVQNGEFPVMSVEFMFSVIRIA